MSYEQSEPHLSWQTEQPYHRSAKEVTYMLDDDNAGCNVQREQREQYPNRGDIDRQLSKAELTLAHCACNDRNQQGTELGHLTSYEQTQELYLIHNQH